MPYLGICGLDFKMILSYLKSAPSNLSNLVSKMPYLDIFELEFQKTIATYQINS